MISKKSQLQVWLFMAILVLHFAAFAFGAGKSSGLVAPGATVKLLQSGFNGTEGPATDTEGNVYFTEVFGSKINKWTWKDGKVTLYRENTGQANGMMFDAKGNLVICEMGNGRVTRDDLKKNVTVIADSVNGKKMRMPNDLWIDPKGGIYISHMYMNIPTGVDRGGQPGGGIPGGDRRGEPPSGDIPEGERRGGPPEGGMPLPAGIDASELGIVYISPDDKKATLVTSDISGPNGLIGTPDGNTLYVGDRGKVWSYKINSDGSLSGKKLFCEKNTDGMAMDEKLNVYLTAGSSILVYSPAGELVEEIAMPEGSSNVEFCGKDRKTLFITYMGNIYTLEMTVQGAPTALDLATGRK